ncbi:metalloprotease TldD [Lysobacteraceae bacterium NML75-0749]|nr:metalloprotease TldD [Xanthomonadaceae bacterium NML03-0222]PJJ98138.1 metalloprotease TldD [Xanthomonadaceae bacterium NML75-0749]PJK05588.1 metalloprotease TldD [Xanthomonadaceae bacterium NML91-0268]
MNQALSLAQSRLLTPAGLAIDDLSRALSRLLASGADFGDLYFQHARRESWAMEDGIVKDGAHAIEQGVGVRAISGEKTGFAYSGEIDGAALLAAADSARAIARGGAALPGGVLVAGENRPTLYAAQDPIDGMANEAKLDALRQVDGLLRALDPRVKQVMVSLSGALDTVLVARSDGLLAADVRPLVRMNIQVIVEQNGRRESGYAGFGGRYGYQALLGSGQPEKFARQALRQALLNLEAVEAPAGLMPVVLGNGWTGVLLHEAVGHGLEGDFNRKGTSTYAGRMGQRVAAPGITIVDDGTLAGRRGSLNIDDEGIPSQCTPLIEDGILTGYMQDSLNARLMGMAPTGNGRRESYAHLVMPRMTNTYMLAGQDDPEDMIRSVKRGLYAVNFGGGQVDITSGKYVFSATEAYLIEDGKITAPVKGATLIGNGPETMQKVTMVGHDLALDEGVGVCGKDGQSVPVGVGQPSLKISELTVGGTQA